MKQAFKVYLDPETQKKLLKKANETGFYGRGALTKFIKNLLPLFPFWIFFEFNLFLANRDIPYAT